MKKLLFLAMLALGLYACGNAGSEKQEEAARDSSDQVQVSKDQAYVDSLMRAEEAKDTNAPAAGTESHEGHDHSSHEGHNH